MHGVLPNEPQLIQNEDFNLGVEGGDLIFKEAGANPSLSIQIIGENTVDEFSPLGFRNRPETDSESHTSQNKRKLPQTAKTPPKKKQKKKGKKRKHNMKTPTPKKVFLKGPLPEGFVERLRGLPRWTERIFYQLLSEFPSLAPYSPRHQLLYV